MTSEYQTESYIYKIVCQEWAYRTTCMGSHKKLPRLVRILNTFNQWFRQDFNNPKLFDFINEL